jgi:hypothetical protein
MTARIVYVTDSITETTSKNQTTEHTQAQNMFSTAMIISGIRCALTYVVFPLLAPVLGIASGVGSGIGLVASIVGIVANLYSIKKFHTIGHQYKWQITALNVSVIGLLFALLLLDLTSLF